MSATHPPQHVVNKLLSEVVSRTQPLNTDPSTLTPEAQMKGKNMKDNWADIKVVGSVLVNLDIYICEIKNYAMYLSLFYLFLLRDKHYKAFLVAGLTHASGNFFSNQPKLLETLFIGHELC